MSAAYNNYIIEHVDNVKKAYNWLVEKEIISNSFSYQLQMNLHDVSKYSQEEYDAYDNYFYNNQTEKIKTDFNYAWLHHIHNNPHHWQHWVLLNDEDGMIALEMPKEYVIEMISDWWAFSHKSGNLYEIFEWYKNHKKNMILHENTKKLIEEFLDRIKEELDKEKKVI